MRYILHAVLDETARGHTEEALQSGQAREQQLYDAVKRQCQQLYETFQAAPAMICVFDGPQYVFQFVNPLYQALVGNRLLMELPSAEAMPELSGQPIFALLDNVYHTEKTLRASEMLVQLDHDYSHPQDLEKRHYNFIYTAHGAGAEPERRTSGYQRRIYPGQHGLIDDATGVAAAKPNSWRHAPP